jgi:hypothetical protein
MSNFNPSAFSGLRRSLTEPTKFEYTVVDRPLRKVLEFTRRSIHDVVNCPIAKREVLGWYKLHRQIQRDCEAVDMNRWWSR